MRGVLPRNTRQNGAPASFLARMNEGYCRPCSDSLKIIVVFCVFRNFRQSISGSTIWRVPPSVKPKSVKCGPALQARQVPSIALKTRWAAPSRQFSRSGREARGTAAPAPWG